MEALSDEEQKVLSGGISAVGGKVVPQSRGLGAGPGLKADVTFVKAEDYVEFVATGTVATGAIGRLRPPWTSS